MEIIDCPVCGKLARWIPVSPWYDCDNSNNHPQIRNILNKEPKANWVNDELDNAVRVVDAWPEWMKRLR